MIRSVLIVLAALCVPFALCGQAAEPAKNKKKAEPAQKAAEALSGLSKSSSPEQLAGALRTVVLSFMPNPLHEASPGWGDQKRVARGVMWHGLHPEVMYNDKNDGHWRKIRVTADDLAHTLILDIRRIRRPTNERMLFDVFLSFDVRVDYTHQHWESGLKLIDASVRAKARIQLFLTFEAITKFENKGGLLPDVVFRLHATSANFKYDNLEMQHIAGIGGDGATIIGEALKGILDQAKPSVERKMIAKANASIVKAADTKEVRLGLSNLLKSTPVKKEDAKEERAPEKEESLPPAQ